jgi:hypothetical protein
MKTKTRAQWEREHEAVGNAVVEAFLSYAFGELPLGRMARQVHSAIKFKRAYEKAAQKPR